MELIETKIRRAEHHIARHKTYYRFILEKFVKKENTEVFEKINMFADEAYLIASNLLKEHKTGNKLGDSLLARVYKVLIETLTVLNNPDFYAEAISYIEELILAEVRTKKELLAYALKAYAELAEHIVLDPNSFETETLNKSIKRIIELTKELAREVADD